MFQRFEVLNGQRDLWQSVLTLNWVQGLTPERIRAYARKHKLDPAEFGVDPDRPKVLTGGSDDHMGLFAGDCGSYVMIPNLQERLKTEQPSALALEALRAGNVAPFGQVGENQKLNIALLDYFAQIATRIEDPGLLRILLHRGETWDKIACFTVSNVLLELRKHKHSRKFFEFVHDALQGQEAQQDAQVEGIEEIPLLHSPPGEYRRQPAAVPGNLRADGKPLHSRAVCGAEPADVRPRQGIGAVQP